MGEPDHAWAPLHSDKGISIESGSLAFVGTGLGRDGLKSEGGRSH